MGKNHGQVVIEYVLLLVLSVALSALLIQQLTSRDPDKAGILTTKWKQILVEIGKDNPDCSITYRNNQGIATPCPP